MKWTNKELDFLRAEARNLSHREIADRLGRKLSAVKSKITALRLGARFDWTNELIETPRREYPTALAQDLADRFGCGQNTIYRKARELGIEKNKSWISEMARERTRSPTHGGRKTRFSAGQAAWNKGIKNLRFAGSEKSWFKKGNLPPTTLPVGAIAVDEDGYHKIKIAMPNRWELLHRHLWRQATGKEIPKDRVLVFRDGDKNNLKTENFELITRDELARRNRRKFMEKYPPEIRGAISQLAALRREINKQDAEK